MREGKPYAEPTSKEYLPTFEGAMEAVHFLRGEAMSIDPYMRWVIRIPYMLNLYWELQLPHWRCSRFETLLGFELEVEKHPPVQSDECVIMVGGWDSARLLRHVIYQQVIPPQDVEDRCGSR